MTTVLALAAPRWSATRALPLLRLLALGVDVVSFRAQEKAGGPLPDAVLATSVLALPVLPDVPVAVWVDDAAELAEARRHGVAACLSPVAELVEAGAVHVPRTGVDVDAWPPISPLVRSRWRERLELPPTLVVGLDPPLDVDHPATALAVASAAVVVGDETPLALALGTPVVTSARNAKRFGLRPGVDVEVAAGPHAASALAALVAADEARAAVLSRRGRRVAERFLDLGAPARELRVLLGLVAPPVRSPADRLADRLAELGTPSDAPVRRRAAVALDPLLVPSLRGGSR